MTMKCTCHKDVAKEQDFFIALFAAVALFINYYYYLRMRIANSDNKFYLYDFCYNHGLWAKLSLLNYGFHHCSL